MRWIALILCASIVVLNAITPLGWGSGLTICFASILFVILLPWKKRGIK